MPLVTLALQTLLPFVYLATGWAALRVPRGLAAPGGWHGTGWRLIGVAFGAHGVLLLAHSQWALASFVRGADSAVYGAYLVWTPAFNHARSLMLLAFALALLALAAASRAGRRFRAWAYAGMAVGAAAGMAVGRAEPAFTALTHYTAVAVWDTAQLVCMLAALFACLLRGRLDRLAWLTVWCYALLLAMNVLLVAGLSRRGVTGEWSPQPWMVHAARMVPALAMAAFALRRLRLSWRNTHVGVLAQRPRPPARGTG